MGIDPRGDFKTKREADLYESSQISEQQKTDPLPVKLGESIGLVLKGDREESNDPLETSKCGNVFEPSEGYVTRKLLTRHRKLVISLNNMSKEFSLCLTKEQF